MLSVPLNSFVHRVPDKTFVIDLANAHGCKLKRVRRSRNWLLVGDEEQLRLLKSQLVEEAHQWIVVAVDKVLPKPVICLQQLLANAPDMTVSQLVSASDCSLVEARRAIDEFEGL